MSPDIVAPSADRVSASASWRRLLQTQPRCLETTSLRPSPLSRSDPLVLCRSDPLADQGLSVVAKPIVAWTVDILHAIGVGAGGVHGIFHAAGVEGACQEAVLERRRSWS